MRVYIYIYIIVKSFSGPSLAFLDVIIWAKCTSLSGPSLFLSQLFVVSSVFCTQLSFVIFWGPVIRQFSKNSVFQNLLIAKHYKKGVLAMFGVFVVQREEKGKRWQLEFLIFAFLGPKNRFVAVDCFCFFGLLKALFLSCFWGARFLGRVIKKYSWTNKKESQKILTDNRKAHFLVVFGCFFPSYLFCCLFLLFFFWRFKGQVRWPKGPPHLALNHPFFDPFCFAFFLLLFLSLYLEPFPL